MTLFGSAAQALLEQYMASSQNHTVAVAIMQGEKRATYHFDDGVQVWPDVPRNFEIGSITKTFTGSLLCKLLQENKIRLDDRVSDYFDVPEGYYYPTVLQLATHTAGYGERLPGQQREVDLLRVNPFRGLTEKDIAEFVRTAAWAERDYPPEYSNTGTAILGQILAGAAGVPIVPLLQQFIGQDLGLDGIYMDRPGKDFIEGYNATGESCGNWRWDAGPYTCIGGLYTTADMLMDYALCQMDGRRPYLAQGHVPCADSFEPDMKSGLFWLIEPQNNIVWHNGGTGCFKTFFGFILEKQSAVAVLSNQKARNGVTPEAIGFETLMSIE